MTPHKIFSIRESLGMTQAQFAHLLGVHTLTVSKWEREVLEPSAHQVALIETFGKAAERKADVGQTASLLLVTKGIAAALHHLLSAALTD